MSGSGGGLFGPRTPEGRPFGLGAGAPSAFPYPDRPQPSPGVSPAPGNVIRPRVVIVTGPTGTVSGVFVYAPGTVPGPGNKPIVSITESATDPFGNAVQKDVAVYAGTGFIQLSESGGSNFLVMRPNGATHLAVPAQLFASVLNAGLVNESLEVQLFTGQETGQPQAAYVLDSAAANGSFLPFHRFFVGNTVELQISSTAVTAFEQLLANAGLAVTGDATVTASDATGPVLNVQNNSTPSTYPDILVTAHAAGDLSLGAAVLGDTHPRGAMDSNGKLTWGPGNAVTDTDLYRSAAGVLKTDGELDIAGILKALAALSVTGGTTTDTATVTGKLTATGGTIGSPSLVSTDTWHIVGGAGEPAFGGGFGAGVGQTPRFRLEPIGGGVVRLDGVVASTAATGAAAPMFQMPAGYRPTNLKRFVVVNSAAGYSVGATGVATAVEVNTSGQVICFPTTSAAGQVIVLEGLTFPVD